MENITNNAGISFLLATLLWGVGTTVANIPETDQPSRNLHNQPLSYLEQRREDIDVQLSQLAHYSLRSGIGSVGYRSKTHPSSTNTEWIRIELGQETPIDQIVLVPTIWRDTEEGFKDDGFPLEFSILAGNSQDPNGRVIASYGAKDHLLSRIAPLVVPCSGTIASWVRLEATALSPRAWDGMFILQLSEILVFNGEENIALGQPVQTSSPETTESNARKRQFLVDGFVPYLMDAAQGNQSIAFVSSIDIGTEPTLTVDLGTIQPLNRIHLHTTDLDDTVPTSTPADFGIPKRLLVEGATRPDYSDAVRLVDYRKDTVFDTGPIIMQRFPETPCRYVRLIEVEPYSSIGDPNRSQIGFAEIELFSQGKNVALGKTVHGDFELRNPERSFSALTDGRNLYGQILPIRDWLDELARRHDLEAERPSLTAELSSRYARQKANLSRMRWLTALLAAGIIFTILVERILHMRQVARIRERFAADLHDELGANVHAIGLLGDLAKDAVHSPDELIETVDEIRALTERTGTAIRFCTTMQQTGLYGNLPEDMHRTARRIMADIKYNIVIEGEDILVRLKPRTRIDLFLFYKESLVNISRHSAATQCSTRLTANNKHIHLTISDNGHGIGKARGNGIPSSLKRRAHLLGARISAESSENGGTCIKLTLRTRRWGRRR